MQLLPRVVGPMNTPLVSTCINLPGMYGALIQGWVWGSHPGMGGGLSSRDAWGAFIQGWVGGLSSRDGWGGSHPGMGGGLSSIGSHPGMCGLYFEYICVLFFSTKLYPFADTNPALPV